MTAFLTENFLLQNDAAIRLYHEYAQSLPIIDYHCHLPPKDIADDRRFSNITQIWLAGDHYKWRAMRAAGVDEQFITGNASDWEKFEKWAETAPKTLRNPLYHWTHLELRRPFGITNRLLSSETAKSIWNDTNAKLQQPDFSARGLMQQMNVELVCTTDDPADSLEHHQKIAADESFGIKVLPTFRPDKALQFTDLLPDGGLLTEQSIQTYNAYLDRLAEVSGQTIQSFSDLIAALKNRHDFFHECGCRLSDHGFEYFNFVPLEDYRAPTACFQKLRTGKVIDHREVLTLQSAILYRLGKMNAEKGWTMQLHIGVIRNNNSRFYRQIGADAGFDSMTDGRYARALSRFFDQLDRESKLPKTIVYNLNPSENAMLATMLGNFQDGITPGKMQFGSGWWFLDQKDGMEQQINTLSQLGLLSQFVGMLTDSRSFLSYTRHEYFRRILCNLLGDDMQCGLLPHDFALVGKMVQDICYCNAKNYFGFDETSEPQA
jgi:glucuronate isomerase